MARPAPGAQITSSIGSVFTYPEMDLSPMRPLREDRGPMISKCAHAAEFSGMARMTAMRLRSHDRDGSGLTPMASTVLCRRLVLVDTRHDPYATRDLTWCAP